MEARPLFLLNPFLAWAVATDTTLILDSVPGFVCVCPSCDSAPRDDLHHLGMVCPAFQEQREATLRPVIDAILQFFDDHQLQRRSDAVWTACLGGLPTTDAEILQKFQQMWIGTSPSPPARMPAPHEDGTPSQPPRESHRYALRSRSSAEHTNTNLSVPLREPSPPDELPSVQDADEDSAMSWLVGADADADDEEEEEASGSQPQIPLWQHVGRFLHRVLGKHFQNIRDKVTQRRGSPPVRPRANAPFSVRQFFAGQTSAPRLGAVHSHVVAAAEQLGDSGVRSDRPRTTSRRQGIG